MGEWVPYLAGVMGQIVWMSLGAVLAVEAVRSIGGWAMARVARVKVKR